MIATRILRLLPIGVLAASAAGCGTTAQSRFYTLESVATAADGPATGLAVMVGPVSVPAAVDRPEIVTAAGTNRVAIDAFDRWAEPLDDGIARAVAGNLATLLVTPEVAAAPLANFSPAYRVSIRVQKFESMPGQSALIDAVWVVHRNPDGPGRPGHTLARETPSGQGLEALAAAHSQAIATLSADIAAAVRAAAAASP